MGTKALISFGVIKLPALVAALALVGCGSGSSNDSSADVSYSSSSMQSSSAVSGNSAPVVDAGAGVTVDSGEQVSLQATVSDVDGEIDSIRWRQLSGPRAFLNVAADDQAVVTFKAPSPGTSATAEMLFEVTAKDNDGASVSDTVTVLINRVNVPPVVELGNLRALNPTANVTLHATAYDLDGEIQSYLWQQVDGESVTLKNATSKVASFDATELAAQARLEFRLTAIDNDGAQGADQVVVVLTNQETPVVSMAFPPARSFTDETSLSAFGSVNVASGTELEKVVVGAGVAPVTATLDGNGNWRADDVLLPSGVSQAQISVAAHDSKGHIGYAESEVKLNTSPGVGYGTSWVQSKAVLLAPDAMSVWVMADGDLDDDLKLIEINLSNGRRRAAITDFTDIGQGTSESTYEDFVYDAINEQFYLSSTVYPEADDDAAPIGKILKVDAVTGLRTELALTGLNGEETLIDPKGLYLHDDGSLYVADQYSGALYKVDLATNEIHLVMDSEPGGTDFYAPDRLAYHAQSDRLLVSVGGVGSVNLSAVTLTDPAQLELVSEDEGISFGPIPIGFASGLVTDEAHNRAYMTTSINPAVVQVDLTDGSRTLLAEEAFAGASDARGLAYDRNAGVIYVVKGRDFQQKLLAIDALSGDTVVVSQSSF